MPKRLTSEAADFGLTYHPELSARHNAQAPTDFILLTVPQVAGILQCSERTVGHLIEHGHLSSLKIGTLRRIPLDEVKALVAAGLNIAASKPAARGSEPDANKEETYV
jgi:excisionase family DNA binding protein